ncbi:uncharacterized protein B0I36DRAFT_313425 [Microdochium trichocladiopsis]|uniref:Mitochondrial pyruvate carrier n=1 Tax=Microdochium trichocladiopsis TaxID=1682393 RepID=A0A9P9BU18_9PEZI|nr:uncharacterized protein B0I36DRAFT_313425 [Microdochium trichocladiopsis]KAH7037151.1 hypothetical protein B0I36DRAFT_313425 [Microdochium trichocladiopsis]
MPATTTLFRAARPVFQSGSANASRATFRAATMRNTAGRRFQSTSSSAAGEGTAQQQQSWFQRMWASPVGLKTVHFWAPVMKWALVLAGVSDFARPAEKLSLTQNGALTATGIIWTRWCFVITPQNYLLAAVNFFLGMVGITQCTRILMWRMNQKDNETALDKVEGKAAEVVDKAKKAVN